MDSLEGEFDEEDYELANEDEEALLADNFEETETNQKKSQYVIPDDAEDVLELDVDESGEEILQGMVKYRVFNYEGSV